MQLPNLPLAGNARAGPAHGLRDFFQGHHGCIAGRGHSQCSVRGATFHRPLRIPSGKKPVDEAGCEGVAATNAIENLQAFAALGFVKRSV